MKEKDSCAQKDLETKGCNTERRKALKNIAVGVGALAGISMLPERWSRPIIGQITIPAHAQTSGEVEPAPQPQPQPQPQGCAIGPGCFTRNDLGDPQGFLWLGGDGLQEVVRTTGGECTGDLIGAGDPYFVAVAADSSEAAILHGTGSVQIIPVTESLPSGCFFWEAVN